MRHHLLRFYEGHLIRSSKANLLKRKALRKALHKIFKRLLEVPTHIWLFILWRKPSKRPVAGTVIVTFKIFPPFRETIGDFYSNYNYLCKIES
jgi:hypothetical protein